MAVPNQQKYKYRTVQGIYPGLEWRVESGSTKPNEYKYRIVQGKYHGLEWRVESGSTKPTEVQV